MADDTLTLLQLINGKSNVRIELGYYRGLQYPRVLIDIGGGRIPADTVTSYRPKINDPVQVLFVDGKPWMLGPAIPQPAEGTIATAPSGGFVKVTTDIGDVSATYPSGLALSSGQQVKLFWSNGPHVLSVMSTTPVAPTPPPAAGSGSSGDVHSQIFTAIQTGAWQEAGGRWSSDQPRASNGYLGAWHYGTKIRDTIPAGSHLVSFEMFIRYASRFGNPPNFALHSQATQAGAPNTDASFAWAPGEGWQPFPAPQSGIFFDALKGGGGHLGISLNHGGVNRFLSLGEDGQSGALRIAWR